MEQQPHVSLEPRPVRDGRGGRALVEAAIETPVIKLQSGPLGGDQQIGAMIAEDSIDFVVSFWDPPRLQPHHPEVKALRRIGVVWNVAVACNRSSAGFMISWSPMASPYERRLPEHDDWQRRNDPRDTPAAAPGAR